MEPKKFITSLGESAVSEEYIDWPVHLTVEMNRCEAMRTIKTLVDQLQNDTREDCWFSLTGDFSTKL